MGFVTMTTMMIPKSVKQNKLLSWQLTNSSHACPNKLFVAINTAKCGTEDMDWELSHCSHYYYIGHGLTETRWHERANLVMAAIHLKIGKREWRGSGLVSTVALKLHSLVTFSLCTFPSWSAVCEWDYNHLLIANHILVPRLLCSEMRTLKLWRWREPGIFSHVSSIKGREAVGRR